MTRVNRKLAYICIIIMALLAMGMYLYSEEEEGGPSVITLEIRFGDHGDAYKGNVTTWEDGSFKGSVQADDNTTIFRFSSMKGENQTVFSALQTASGWGNFTLDYRDHQTPKGVFVETIAGVENGPLHWQYYLNDEYAVRGSDSVSLQDGDHVIWSYE